MRNAKVDNFSDVAEMPIEVLSHPSIANLKKLLAQAEDRLANSHKLVDRYNSGAICLYTLTEAHFEVDKWEMLVARLKGYYAKNVRRIAAAMYPGNEAHHSI